MNTNKKGFTLIELLVVIVIIGILATISVATFGGYFKKARDAERQTVVQNVATIMKVINATNETVNYGATDNNNDGDITDADEVIDDKAALDASLTAQGYTTPESKNGARYTYAYDTATKGEFFIAVCSEETAGKGFIAGTPTGVRQITFGTASADYCATAPTAAAPVTITIPSSTYEGITW